MIELNIQPTYKSKYYTYNPVKVADEKLDFLITESEIIKPKFKIANTNLAMIILQS